ncbi:MAG: GGDEF domain-containing protein [Desulfovibrio sp.]|nr:GGDEF domain-containing protein [Desulfovibrio sp.]
MPAPRNGLPRRFTLVASVMMLLATFFIVCIFYWLYDSSKQNILGTWRNEMQQATQKIIHYLKMPIDAVAFSGVTINRMLGEGKSHEEVGKYLIEETAIYASIIRENNTGVYGFYKGRYLDGSGWTPPADYKPKERPWYTAAVQGKGAVVLVKPFLNLQTNTMMTSVSQLLRDGESVVSMDIFLDSVQHMVEEMAAGSIVQEAYVVDRDGIIVAHSDVTLVGKDLNDSGTTLQQEQLQRIKADGNRHFEINNFEGKYTVFIEPINENWSSVYVLNEDRLNKPLVIIYLASGFFLLFVMGISFLVVMHMSRKYAEAEHLNQEIQAVANIYVAMVHINLRDDTITCIQSNPDIDALLEGNFNDFSKRALAMAEKMSADQSRDMLKQFMNPETLEERLRDTRYITQEFMDDKERWIRLRFIVINREADGSLHHVLLAFESIDEDRKRQEKLRKLSETDLMTGIRNRGSGERLIRRAMAERRSGMFCLMDADKFKSINDVYGHAVGDKVIIAIADCMKKTFRDSDIIFRLGGDEFSAFSEGVNDETIAQRIIKRLFDNIDRIAIPELQDRKITLSVGVTFYPATHADSFEAMYQRADSGTYESKKETGNKATFILQKEHS